MNRILSIPNHTIDKFKCSLCDNHLSHFPVSIIEEDKNVCGRCTLPEGTVRFHCKIFEEFAQHIKFPCRYKEQGCTEELFPNDVPCHEENCHFKLVKCPGIKCTNCCWQGARKNVLSHCQKAHKDLFLKDGTFELNLNVPIYSKKFLEHDGSLFRVCLNNEFDSKTLFFRMFHVKEAIDLENYSYQVVLSKNKTNIGVESVTTTFSERNWCKIALDSLIKENKDRIVGKIAFKTTAKDVVTPKRELNKDLLSVLKCSICKYYALPPIHQFEDNTIKCENCWIYRTNNGSRNFTLDRIAEMLNYPCRYKRNGCNLVLQCKKMKKHLMNCPFQNVFCPFCGYHKLSCHVMKDIKPHVLEKHGDMLVENDEEISVDNYVDNTLTRIIHYSDHIFQIKCRISRTDFKWWVNILGHKKENFLYEVEVHNVKGNNRIIMQRKCLQSEDYNEETTFCKVDRNDLLQWEYLLKIGFRVRIFKQ